MCHFREGRGAGGSAACLGHCSSPAAGTAREIHPPEPGLINHLNYSTASSFQDLSRSVFTQNRVENAPGPTFRVSSIWPLWGVSGGSDRQGCSVRGAPAPATCHIAGLMASDSSICASPRDERAICGGEGTGERDEQGHAGRGMQDAAASLVPCSAPWRKPAPLPRNPPLSPAGVQATGISMQCGVQAGAAVPVMHPLAVPQLGAEYGASLAKLEPPAPRWLCRGCHLPQNHLRACRVLDATPSAQAV